jgi:hypothetical protein
LTVSTEGRSIGSIGWRVARSIGAADALARGDEQDRLALAPGAPGAADAVHIGFGVVGNVVIQHVADAFHVQAARGDIGGHQDVELAVLQPLDGALALGLRHVAVDRRRGETARLQRSASSSVAILVRANTIMPSKGSTSRMRVSASSLCMPLTSQ